MARILLLTPQLPYPPHQGTSLRNYHIVRGLAERHEVTLLSFLEAGQEMIVSPTAVSTPLHTLCQQIITVPVPPRTPTTRLRQLLTTRLPDMAHRLHSDPFNEKLVALLQQRPFFDIIQIEGIELAPTIPLIRQHSPQSHIVFDNHNAETDLQRRAMLADLPNPRRWPAAAYSWLQVARLRRFEGAACREVDWITAVSATDKETISHFLRAQTTPPITVIPNCLDLTDYAPQPLTPTTPRFDLLFSGKMDYRPNIDAVLWFATAVWPHILAQRPQTTWAIVGQKPHPRLDQLRQMPGITLTGWVEAVQPYLAGATVCILPFRIGSGTRLKLIEALAAGKAIASTRIGAEGFDVVNERELLLADEPAPLATAVLRLLHDADLRDRLGGNGRLFAQQFDWRIVIPRFHAIYTKLKNYEL